MEISDIMNFVAIAGVFGVMLTIGLSLTLGDFRKIAEHPKAVFVGLAGQLLVLPIVALMLAKAMSLPDHFAMGLMIIAACPGGATSNAFSFLARGDVALSISLTALSSIFAFLTVPLVINFSFSVFQNSGVDIRLSFIDTAIRIFLTTALPVAIGMMARQILPAFAQIIQKPLFVLSFACVLIPSVSLVASFQTLFAGVGLLDAAVPLILNVLMVFAGFSLGRLFKLESRQSRTLAIEIGVQNFVLVIVIVFGFLRDERLLLPGLIYLPSMLITGALLSVFFSRRAAKNI